MRRLWGATGSKRGEGREEDVTVGDKHRFDLLAALIEYHFPNRDARIADIAGGQGWLQLALRERGYSYVVTFDKRKMRKRRRGLEYQYRWFDFGVREEFDLLVGMHPDEATDIIVVEACRRGVPFVVCPCCVMPNATTMWAAHNYRNWLDHLEREARRRGYGTERFYLRMNGKNAVLKGARKSGRDS
jgi:hypothetical protein